MSNLENLVIRASNLVEKGQKDTDLADELMLEANKHFGPESRDPDFIQLFPLITKLRSEEKKPIWRSEFEFHRASTFPDSYRTEGEDIFWLKDYATGIVNTYMGEEWVKISAGFFTFAEFCESYDSEGLEAGSIYPIYDPGKDKGSQTLSYPTKKRMEFFVESMLENVRPNQEREIAFVLFRDLFLSLYDNGDLLTDMIFYKQGIDCEFDFEMVERGFTKDEYSDLTHALGKFFLKNNPYKIQIGRVANGDSRFSRS